MSHGSCVAALANIAPLPPISAPTASTVAARTASSARLACLARGLTVIVESALPFADPVNGRGCAAGRAHAGTLEPFVGKTVDLSVAKPGRPVHAVPAHDRGG